MATQAVRVKRKLETLADRAREFWHDECTSLILWV
jgi:hypothetical protein